MDTTRLGASGRIYCKDVPAVVYVQKYQKYEYSALTINCELMQWIHFECQDQIVPVMDMLHPVPATAVVCAIGIISWELWLDSLKYFKPPTTTAHQGLSFLGIFNGFRVFVNSCVCEMNCRPSTIASVVTTNANGAVSNFPD